MRRRTECEALYNHFVTLSHMSEEGIEQKYVKEAFDMNWVVPLGPNVNAFEEDLKRFVGEGKEVVALVKQ